MVSPEHDWIYDPPERCPCGDDDPEGCMFLNFGYVYCACGDHHRLPVAKQGPCPVDINSALLDEADRRGEGVVSEQTRADVLQRF